MAKQEVARQSRKHSVTIASGAALSDAIDMREFATGTVIVPAVWSAANMGFQVCDTVDGTYVILNDTSGVPAQVANIDIALAGAYEISTEVASSHFVKLWSKHLTAATTTDVNQGADRVIAIMLKG